MEVRSSWVLSRLGSKRSKGQKQQQQVEPCFVPVADIVLFHDGEKPKNAAKKGGIKRPLRRQPSQWVHSDASGRLCCSRGASLSWSRIRDSFLRLADGGVARDDADPTGPICTLVMVNGTHRQVDRATFSALIAGAKRDGGLSSVAMMKAVVGCGHRRDPQLVCKTTFAAHGGCDTVVESGRPRDLRDLEASLDGLTRAFVAALSARAGRQVQRLELTFAEDHEGVMRVCDVGGAVVASDDERQRDDDEERVESASSSARRAKPGSKRRFGGMAGKRASSTSSTPELPSLSSNSSKDATAAPPAAAAPLATCQGDFCGFTADASDSLEVLDMDADALDADGEDSAPVSCAFELQRVLATSLSRAERARAGQQQQQQQQQQKPKSARRRALLLARDQMHFVTGAVRGADAHGHGHGHGELRDDGAFGRAWQALDARLQFELGAKHGDDFFQEAPVCSGCHAVYAKIQRLRDRAFQPREEAQSQSQTQNQSQTQTQTQSQTQSQSQAQAQSQAQTKAKAKAKTKVKAGAGAGTSAMRDVLRATLLEARKELGGKGPDRSSSPAAAAAAAAAAEAAAAAPAREKQPLAKEETGRGGLQPSAAETAFLLRRASDLSGEESEGSRQRQERQEREELREEVQRLRQESEQSAAELQQLRRAGERHASELRLASEKRESGAQLAAQAKEALAAAQRGFVAAMNEKDEEVARAALEAERARHTLLAAHSRVEGEDSLASQLFDAQKLHASMTKALEGANARLADAEAAGRRLRDSLAEHKRGAAGELQARVRQETAALQARLQALEVQAEDQDGKIRELGSTAEATQSKEAELRRQIAQLVGDKRQLKEDLAAASQSLRSVSSLGTSEDAAIAAVRATCEARVAQLGNEVDFVRQQAAAEGDTGREAAAALAACRAELAAAVAEHRQGAAEAAKAHKADLEKRETAFTRDLQVPRAQISLLEEKVATLQTNLQRAGNETGAAKRKLQVAEQDVRRGADERRRINDDKLALERNLAELQATVASKGAAAHVRSSEEEDEEKAEEAEEAEEAGATSAAEGRVENGRGGESKSKSRSEKTKRSLENEVNFVRKQLEVEGKARGELAAAVEASREQLKETLLRWKSDSKDKEAALRQHEEAAALREAALREAKVEADVGLASAAAQLRSLKESYGKARDQLQMDQQAMESSSFGMTQLKEELRAATERAAALEAEAQRRSATHQTSLQSLNETVATLQKERAEAVERLQARLAAAHQQASAANAAMLSLRDASAEDRAGADRLASCRLLRALSGRRSRAATHAALLRLRGHAVAGALAQAAAEREAQLRSLAAAERAAMKEGLEARAREDVQRRAEEVAAEALASGETDLARARSDAAAELRAQEAQLREELRGEAAAEASRLQAEACATQGRAEETHRAALAAAEQAHRGDKQAALRLADDEKVLALAAAAEEHAAELAAQSLAADEAHGVELAAAKREHSEALEALRSAAEASKQRELEALMTTAERGSLAALQQAEEQSAAKVAALEAGLVAAQGEALARAEALAASQLQAALERERAVAAAAQQQELAALAARHQSEVGSAREALASAHAAELARVEAAHEARAAAQRREHGAALQALTGELVAAHEAEVAAVVEREKKDRAKALTMTTEKWQRVLQECTDEALRQQEAEAVRGTKDARRAVVAEKERQEAALKGRVEALAKTHAAALAKARTDFAAALEEQKTTLDAARAEALAEAESRHEAAAASALEEAREAGRVAEEARAEFAAQELREAVAGARRDGEEALKACARSAATRVAGEVSRARAQAGREAAGELARVEAERAAAEQEILDECDRVTEKKLAQGQLQLQDAVMRCREQCEERHRAAELELRRAGDEKAAAAAKAAAERAAGKAAGEHARVVEELRRSQQLLEDSEDMAYDLQGSLTRQEKMNRLLAVKMRLDLARSVSRFCTFRRASERASTEGAATEREAREAQQALREAEVERARAGAERLANVVKSLHDTLATYKRKELVQHKVDTALVQDDLRALQATRDEVAQERDALAADIGAIEGQIKQVEGQFEQLNKVSAIQDGHINVAHAKRKRRLDQDFEKLLQRASEKKDRLNGVDARMADVQGQADDKEDALKDMETKLVRILVSQQKRLLSIIAAAKAKPPAALLNESTDSA